MNALISAIVLLQSIGGAFTTKPPIPITLSMHRQNGTIIALSVACNSNFVINQNQAWRWTKVREHIGNDKVYRMYQNETSWPAEQLTVSIETLAPTRCFATMHEFAAGSQIPYPVPLQLRARGVDKKDKKE